MITRLDSLDDPRLDVFARLTDVQLRSRLEPERAVLIAESAKVAERALEAGLEPLSLLVEEKWLRPRANENAAARESPFAELLAQVEEAAPGTPVFVLPSAQLEKLTGFQLTRGLLAAFRRPKPLTVAQAVEGARLVAVLENITNHTNVGAIFRSAAALGVDAVLVSPACYDPFYRRAVRVSMGTVFQIPWARIPEEGEGLKKELESATAEEAQSPHACCFSGMTSLRCEAQGEVAGGRKGAESEVMPGALPQHDAAWAREKELARPHARSVHRGPSVRAGASPVVPYLRSQGFTVAAMALEPDSIRLTDPLLQEAPRVALVFGTEGEGLEPATLAACDATVCIPMRHGVDSLNVAASSAVAFYALANRPGAPA